MDTSGSEPASAGCDVHLGDPNTTTGLSSASTATSIYDRFEPLVQNGRFANVPAGTYAVTWECVSSGPGDAAVEGAVLDVWTTQ
jgi:hypothetical protein